MIWKVDEEKFITSILGIKKEFQSSAISVRKY